MHYHFGVLAPSSQINHQSGASLVQRSLPTCTLSLASATASTASNHIVNDLDAMMVDPPSFSVTSLSMVGKGGIPFPTPGKRTHSLLRATAYCPRSTIAVSANQFDDGYPSTDMDPPRKRTRTSALPSSKTRFNRATSSRFLFNLNHPTSKSFSLLTMPKSTPILPPPISTLKDTSQTSSSEALSVPSQPDSHVDLSPSSPIAPFPLNDGCNAVSKPLVYAIKSPAWRHKRATSSELRIFVSLHQALVYGLAMRWPIGMSDVITTANTTDGMNSEPLQPDEDGENPLYMQDALLARHLRTYLRANGIDAFREAFREINSDFDNAPRLTYRKVVASLIMRHHCSSNRSRAKTSSRENARPQRKPSRLSTSMNLD